MKKIALIKKLLLILSISFGLSAQAQKILLEKHTRDLFPAQNTNGPNLKHFKHAYLDYGFSMADSKTQGITLLTARSNTFSFGVRYKRKLAEFLSIGYAFYYNFEDFAIKQEAGKIFPNSILHSKEKLNFNNLGSELYTRLNFAPRGNTLGLFLDLGGFFNWTFTAKHKTTDIFEDYENNAKEIQVISKHLEYTEPFHYGVCARLGYNRYILTASYRLSGYIKEEFDVVLPKLSIGFEIGLH